MSRAQKKEALALLQSRIPSAAVALKLLGWITGTAELEAEGRRSETAGKTLAEFVRVNETEIRNCPIRS